MNIDLIRNTPLFADLSEGQRSTIAAAFVQENRARGTVLYNSGEKATSLYLLHSGFIRLIGENGMALATLGPGSLLGESEYLRGMDHVMSAVAAGDVSLGSLSDVGLRKLLQQHPDIGITLSRSFGDQLVQMEDYLVGRLAATEFLGDLPRNLLRALATRLHPQALTANAIFYRPGDEARGLFLMEEGQLELHSESSNEPIGVCQPGDLFGILPILTHKPYTQTARSVGESLVWVLPAAEFYHLGSQFPALRRTLGRRVRSKLSPADQTQAVIRLAQTPIFANMGAQSLHAVAQRLVLQHVPAGEIIYQAGDSGDALFLVDDGEIELTAETASGVIEEVDRIEIGRYFGEMSLLTGKNRTEDATAIRNTNLWVLYKADLDELVALHPTIGAALNQVVAAKLAADVTVIDDARYRHFPLFNNLSARDLREAVAQLRPTRYRSGEQIYRAGTPGQMLFLVERGHVRMQPLVGGNGWVVGEGELFGEHAVLTNQLHGQHAYAETDVDLLTISREDLEALMMRLPGLAMNLSRLLSQRFTDTPAEIIQKPVERASGMTIFSQRRRTAAARQLPAVDEPARPGIGEWFANLSSWAKIRLVVLVLILTYLFTVAAWASFSALLTEPTVAASGSAVVSSTLSGSSSSRNMALALASTEGNADMAVLAEEGSAATPTYTPFPTNTPPPTNTPIPTIPPTETPVPPTATFTPVPPTPVQVAVVQQVAAAPVVEQAAPPVEEAAAPAEPEAAPPAPESRSASLLPPRAWDGRLDGLGIGVQDAGVPSGQPYWRLIEARWQNEQEAGGKHHIYVEVLDEGGQRITGQPVTVFWGGGGDTQVTENKPAPEYAFNYPMYKAGNSYNVKIEGLPSDVIVGLGLGTPGEQRMYTIHTNTLLTFQKVVAP